MFSTNNTFKTDPQNTEENNLITFLANSSELKKMEAIANTFAQNNPNDLLEMVEAVKKSKSFCEALHATEHFEIDNSDNIVISMLGRNKINSIFYAGSFFNNRANFFYNALHFREKIVNIVFEKNYYTGYTYQLVNRK